MKKKGSEMQSTSIASIHGCCYLRLFHIKLNPFSLPLSISQSHSPKLCFVPVNKRKKAKFSTYPIRNHSSFEQFYSFSDFTSYSKRHPETGNQCQLREDPERGEGKPRTSRGLFGNMSWADFRAALGQRFNVEGIISVVAVVTKDQHLALPHVAVPDIRYIDWSELHRRGFKGVVFDKDNTITAPYSLTLWGSLGSSIELCKSVLGPNIAIFSNSAGLYEYDRDGSKARLLEGTIGIKVIRHRVKKPAGTAEEIEKHFGCQASQLVMVGDRPFTDVVYGNRNGFLTILTEPLSVGEEPYIVRQVRKLETSLVHLWHGRGLTPPSHNLLPDTSLCVKDPPL